MTENVVSDLRLCAAADVPPDTMVRIADVPGLDVPLAVANVDGEYLCVDDTCSHQEASLADGWLEDGCVECPLHESRFDLRTGEPDAPPAKAPIRTHRVEVVDGYVVLRASDPGVRS